MKQKNSPSRKRQDKTSVNSHRQSSAMVGALFSDAVARQKAKSEAEAAEAIAGVKAETTEAITRVKAQAEEKARKYTDTIAKVKAQALEKTKAYTDTIARVKAQAAEAIAKVRAQAEERTRTYTNTIARIKAKVEEKKRVYTDTTAKVEPSATVGALFLEAVAKQKAKLEAEAAEAIAKVKTEAEEKAKAYTDTIAKVKAQAEEAIAEQKARSEAEAAEAIARVKAEAAKAIARVKAEAEEKTKTYIDTIARTKVEAEEKARAYTDTVGKGKPSATVDALFSKAVAKQKAKPETKAKGKAREYTDTIAEGKAREYTDTIAEVKAQAEEKEKAYTDTIAEVKAQAEKAIASLKAEAAEAIIQVRTEAEKVITNLKAQVKQKAGAHTDTTPTVDTEEKAPTTNGSKEQPVSKTIQKMVQSLAVLPGEHSLTALELCAKDIMQKKVVWVGPDDSVQQAFAETQQHNTGYVLVGQDEVLEGIVSKSDLTGAISPYLRPVFAKCRRPLDDATLQIRIKWIMSRPVHTIKPETPLVTIMENMHQLGVLCLPVVDQQGKVQGLVVEVNIFKALLKLKSSPNISISGKVPQKPVFGISSYPPPDTA